MIAMVGIKKDTAIDIREKFAISENNKEKIYKSLLSKFKEVVILNTCNRTEIYLNYVSEDIDILKEVTRSLEWEEQLLPFIFIIESSYAYKHLCEVVCGYHSKLIGEDQILGQIKDAYAYALKVNEEKGELLRLFQQAITCGKEFRKEAKLYEIPVSTSSIAVNKIVKEDFKKIMVIGHGEVGSRIIKSLVSHKRDNIYLVVRNTESVQELKEAGIKIIDIKEKNKYINEMECIISCTSAPHLVVRKEEIIEVGLPLTIFDMSVPRDVEKDIARVDRVRVYNIDEISKIDDKNRILRIERMKAHRYIINNYIGQFEEWLRLRQLTPVIRQLKDIGTKIYTQRSSTFQHKIRDIHAIEVMDTLLKSVSDAYVNRAIEVLKEETLEGDREEALRIIKKIFKI